MKKSILNFGKTLNKTEQKQITGGFGPCVCLSSPIKIVSCSSTCPDGTQPISAWA